MVSLIKLKEFSFINLLSWFVDQLKAIKQNGDVKIVKPAVKVKDVIGSALPRIGPYKKLNNTQQVVALIDDVS